MKKYCKWILLIIILVAIVLLIISAILNKTTDNNVLNVQNTVVDMNETFKFKIFEYVVPNRLKYIAYSNRRFKIEGNDWYAIVGIIYDQNKKIYDDIDKFKTTIKTYDKTITADDVVTINDIPVVTFQKEKTKSLLCYFATPYDIDYEVEIFNRDGSYKTDALDKTMESLMNATYDDVTSFDSYVGYFTVDNENGMQE